MNLATESCPILIYNWPRSHNSPRIGRPAHYHDTVAAAICRVILVAPHRYRKKAVGMPFQPPRPHIPNVNIAIIV